MATSPVEVKKTPALRPPTDPWQNFRSEFDRLFDRFAGFGMPSFRRMFDAPASLETNFSFNVPAVDVTEDDNAYKIAAELPGLEEKDIDVSLAGDVLTLKGEKHQEKEEKSQNWYVSERTYGSFQRAFELPPGVDRERIAAEFAKGVLTITLPKNAEAQRQQRKIDVRTP